jgi:DNA polymerase-3 subunit gamma/tau
VAAVKEGSDPRIQLELALLKSTQPQADLSLQALMFRIEQLERRLGDAGEAVPSEPPAASRGAPPRRGGGPSAAAAEAVAQPDREAEASPAPELEHVQQVWPAVADAVRERNGMLGALLAQARPIALEGDLLKVAFGEDATFAKKKAEANRALVVEALRGLTGHGLTLVYELNAGATDGPALLSEEELLERLRSEFGATEVPDEED